MPESRNCCALICHINVRIGWTIFGILFGISAVLTYAIKFENWSATATSAIATLFACQTLWIYWALKKNTIVEWKRSRFLPLIWPNIFIGLLGLIGCIICYIFAGIMHQGAGSISALYGENLWITGSWSLVITKWTWQNAFFARRYVAKLDKDSVTSDVEVTSEEEEADVGSMKI
uniref:Heme transporter hrg-1 n=1 Tax=Caenorhabditis japonica TaxID=281687 RepID=A0A8R1ETS7_CAEJA